MLFEGEFLCSTCGSANTIAVDGDGGRRQRYVEDCQNCCRPNALEIEIDDLTGEVYIEASPEAD